MILKGSCHCQAIGFEVQSDHPYPFNRCYCSICRKTAGSGGYAINLSADRGSLVVRGQENLGIYQARQTDPQSHTAVASPGQRNFCKLCGSHLWVWDPRWPELLHPHAGAIDTELPVSPEYTHLMLASKASWVPVERSNTNQYFDEYPSETIAEWHQRITDKTG